MNRLILLILFSCSIFTHSFGKDVRKSVVATRTGAGLKIDGNLNDSTWTIRI